MAALSGFEIEKPSSKKMHPHYCASFPSLGSMARVQFNPIDGCQYSSELSAQLNLTNDHKKKESPHLQECPDAFTWSHVMLNMSSSVLSWASLKKRMLSRLSAGYSGDAFTLKKLSPWNSGQLFNTKRHRQVKHGKKAGCFTLLRRITNSKV